MGVLPNMPSLAGSKERRVGRGEGVLLVVLMRDMQAGPVDLMKGRPEGLRQLHPWFL